MEILSPSPPPSPAPGAASMDAFLHHSSGWPYRAAGALHHGGGDGAARLVHVAVGRSPEKTLALLRWAFRRFGCARVALLHVHQPSPVIPTLLGRIPAAQATEELVLSHRKSEKEEMTKILLTYLTFCQRAQVQASLLVTENEIIHDGVASLVKDNGVTKLVMGSTPDNCFKLKAGHSKASFLAKNAPAFCEIWFVWRGRHIWTREASATIGNSISIYNEDDVMIRKRIRFSPDSNNSESINDGGFIVCETSTPADYEPLVDVNHFYNMNISNLQHAESAFNSTFWPSSVHMETSQEVLDKNFEQVMMEAERTRKEAFVELLKRKETESRVANAFARAKASEYAQKQEMKMCEELEGSFVATRKQQEDLVKDKEKALAGLDSSMRRLAILDVRAKYIGLRMNEAAAELELIQSSIGTLGQRETHTQKLEDGLVDQVEGCTYAHARLRECSSVLGDDLYKFRELTLLDIHAATCQLSESFKIQTRSHGCVYKGEIVNRSVMIHKLHSHSIQSLMQFQQEVHILSTVRHPNLVTLIGSCPEALCLVYEYVPNKSLHDLLLSNCKTPQLPWKIRARIVGEIANALLLLQSCQSQMIVHGDLKLENILVDADLRCKIADFGICRVLKEDYSAFNSGSELKGSFPDYKKSKPLSPGRDMYSFGIVILQLLTGKQPVGLANEVRHAMSCGKLCSILDPTAGEWPVEVAQRLAEFGLECCGHNFPELTPEMVRDLEQLHLMRERQAPSFFLCPILKEVMHDPQVGADGFTYEGRAIREWMEHGRTTSPVTNVRLKHPNLTPNHALRFAIQDWLGQC